MMSQRYTFVLLSLCCFFAVNACSSNDEDQILRRDTGITNPPSDSAVKPVGDSSSDAMNAIVDPAPTYNTPGNFTSGTNCPTSDISTFTIDAATASSHTFTGTVTNATGNGTFFVLGPNGEKISGPIPTEDNNYEVTIPLFCGTQTVKLLWSNSTCQYIAVFSVTRTGCQSVDIQITLTWDALGLDWELHLIKPSGKINDKTNLTDCTWTTCISSSPDWGVKNDSTDNPHKDVDNTGAYGPENIYLSKPETGTYTVMVEHWAAGSATSKGQAILNIKGQVTTIPITNLVHKHVRTVATISWPSGAVTTRDTDYDCSASWSSGCTAAIP